MLGRLGRGGGRRCTVGYGPVGSARHGRAAERRVERRERAEGVLVAGNDPRVEHPRIPARDEIARAAVAVGSPLHALAHEHSVDDAQSGVPVPLGPGPLEPGRRLRTLHVVAQTDEPWVVAAVEQQHRRRFGVERLGDARPVDPVRTHSGQEARREAVPGSPGRLRCGQARGRPSGPGDLGRELLGRGRVTRTGVGMRADVGHLLHGGLQLRGRRFRPAGEPPESPSVGDVGRREATGRRDRELPDGFGHEHLVLVRRRRGGPTPTRVTARAAGGGEHDGDEQCTGLRRPPEADHRTVRRSAPRPCRWCRRT